MPLVTDMNPDQPSRFNGGWSGNPDREDSMDDINNALDEALENFELATDWMAGKGKDEAKK